MAMWNRAVEALPRAELAALQQKGLGKTLRRVFGRDVDFARLPLTSAATLRKNPPLTRCCVDRRDLVELHIDTSSTEPLAVAATKTDLLQNAESLARGFAMAGLEKGDAFALLEPLSLVGDGSAGYQGCRKMGLFCVPVGGVDLTLQAALLRDYRVKGLMASAASLLRLPPATNWPSLRVGLVPAVGLTAGLRRELEARLGLTIFATYGCAMTGGAGTIGQECRCHDGLHIWEDQYLVEIIDPQTGAVLPDGERGEIVLTTLTREAMPLVRYRTGHFASILSREPCACGRTSFRLVEIG